MRSVIGNSRSYRRQVRSRLHIQAHPPLLVLEGALTRLEIGDLACESDLMRACDTPIWLSLSDRRLALQATKCQIDNGGLRDRRSYFLIQFPAVSS
jgi:hypothetical protein